MTDRERLIELLKQGNREYSQRSLAEIKKILDEKHSYNSKTDKSFNLWEFIADYLLANGVIVPPCKVGDKIYWVANHITNRNIKEFCVDYDEKNDIGVCEFTVYGFMKREERNLEILIEEIEYYNIFYLREKNIGKTVFLTKEEAEAKLKEHQNETNIYD